MHVGGLGKHGVRTSLSLVQIMMLTAAGMLAMMIYGFFKLPNADSGVLLSQVSDLHNALSKQGEQFNELQKQMSQLAAEEHHTAEMVKHMAKEENELMHALKDGGMQIPQVVPTQQQHLSVQKPQRIQGVDAARGSVASRPAAPKPALGEDGDIVPDMTAYVKRMSIIDENGCSSGQRYNKERRECEWMTTLQRIPTISPEDFEYYFNLGRAIILTNFTDDWKAFQNWTPERLKQNYGKETVNVQKGRSKRKDFETAQHLLRRDMKFADFIDAIMDNKVENDLYLTANNNLLHRREMRGLMADMEPFYPGFLWVDPTQTHFWFGPGGTKTPLHFDPISLFHTHVSGRKLWRLWPPEMGPYLYHREKVYSDVDTYNPDHKKFPLYRHAHVIEENIMPGETLFVPTGWWHTVDILETPTISLSATSFLSRFMRFESKLRAKWPQKSAQPVGQPRGPALPGEQTPKTFNIHDWAVATSVKHLRMGELPVSKLKWDDVLATNDMEAVRKIVERWSTEASETRSECYLFMLLNPKCSDMSFDWKAWMIENLGLKNAVHSLVQVMSRDGDDTTMHGIQNTVRRCLKEGEDLWSAPGVDATASAHQDLMDRIHRNQKQIGSNKDGEKKWNQMRHVNNWQPPNEYQIQKANAYPGAEKLSDLPRSTVIRNFLTPEECEGLIRVAEPMLVRSTVIGADNDAGRVSNDRTSMGAWPQPTNPSVAALELKAATLTGMDVTRAEGVHVLRYLEGETYKRHLDGCDTGAPNGPISPECERFLHRAGDRIASVIVMLQAPEAGGNTAFPRVKVKEDGTPEFKMNYAGECSDETTLQTKLSQGDALLFWGYHPLEEHPLGRMDWASEHTGCKVEAGRKWIATVWFRGSTWRARPNYPQLPQQ